MLRAMAMTRGLLALSAANTLSIPTSILQKLSDTFMNKGNIGARALVSLSDGPIDGTTIFAMRGLNGFMIGVVMFTHKRYGTRC